MATTLEVPLDEGVDVVQPTIGWHEAILTNFEINPNKAGTGENMVFSFELAESDPDRPGMPWTYYLPLPTKELTDNFAAWKKAGNPKAKDWDPNFLTKDGRHKYQATIQRIKKVSAAFGGAESGGLKPEVFGRMLGKKVKIQLAAEKEDGQPTGRLQFGFDAIAPA